MQAMVPICCLFCTVYLRFLIGFLRLGFGVLAAQASSPIDGDRHFTDVKPPHSLVFLSSLSRIPHESLCVSVKQHNTLSLSSALFSHIRDPLS